MGNKGPIRVTSRSSDKPQRGEPPAQDWLAPCLEPIFQHPGVHRAEIHFELQIALEQIPAPFEPKKGGPLP